MTPPTDPSTWSVVPFKEPDVFVPSAPSSNIQISNESSLTWWKDPEDPSDRIALDDL